MDVPLDVTPNTSFNTVQFQREYINVIVTSIIVTFILTNIGSIVSKIMLLSPLTSFPFNSFRRFILYETIHDPVQMFNWLRGKYKLDNKHWQYNGLPAKPKYLLFPLSARALLIAASVVSIAITVPTQRVLPGCNGRDFRPSFNISNGRFLALDLFCRNMPLKSEVGVAKSRVEACFFISQKPTAFNSTAVVVRVALHKDGVVRWDLETNEVLNGFQFYFIWTQISGQAFNSFAHLSISADQMLDVVMEALAADGHECKRGDIQRTGETDKVFHGASMLATGCVVADIATTTLRMQSFIMTSLIMERVEERQVRYDISTGRNTTACPIDVVVQQPYVNILPLLVLLVVTFVLNMVFTVISLRHGSVVESYFHVMKEVFGYDCMSNPLEESLGAVNDRNEVYLADSIREYNGPGEMLDLMS